MYNNQDPIEEQRRKHFESLNQDDGIHTQPLPSEQQTSTRASERRKRTRRSDAFLPALFGAIVGAVIALIAGYLLITYTNILPSGGYSEDGGTVINYEGGDASSSVEAVAQVVPESVVGIAAVVNETGTNIFGQPTQSQGMSVGSGFFVTEDGYIVTNNHVVSDAPQSITISTASGEEYSGKRVWGDSDLDIAIVKVDGKGFQPLSLGDSESLKVGQTVIAIGNPLGLNYSRTVTSGIVSAIDRTLVSSQNQVVAEGLIQTDAAINSGNSGGPLVNVNGEVVGINTYKATAGEGIGFAIPINLFKPIIQEVIETGNFAPRIIGVTGYDPEQAKYILNDQVKNFSSGFYIVSVTDGSPAQKAGLQQGDIIKKVDGKDINTLVQMRTIFYSKKVGDSVEVTYERNGQTQNTTMQLTSN